MPVTTYTHVAGVLVSSVAESEWSPLEQDRMLALAQYEASLCPMCGGPISECTDQENEGRFKVDPPTRCHRKTAQIMAMDDLGQRKHTEALMQATRLVKPERPV